jgi:putative ABC transport system ATP-binding protein
MGYVYQRPADNLIPYLTVLEHVGLAARMRHASGAGGPEILGLLGLWDRREHLPRQLSGGEQQRLAFAQAVVGEPALVVADEPTAELDSASGRALLEAVRTLAERGTSFVVSTHDAAVERMATRVYRLRHGAMETEHTEGRGLAVIDGAGRIQLPPAALALFPDRRAQVEVEDGHVRITPP